MRLFPLVIAVSLSLGPRALLARTPVAPSGGPPSASATPPPPRSVGAATASDEALVVLLSLIHEEPSVEALQRFGPELESRLAQVAEDPTVPRLARVRAVSSLGRLGTEAALRRIEDLVARGTALPPRLRMAVFWTLGHFFEAVPRRLDVIRRGLADPDPGVREAAVRALARVGTPEALAALEAHRLRERHVAVRAVLRALKAATRVAPLPREGRVRRPQILPKEGGAR
ncbi:MAG: hypothetical protein D6729_10640 [Deltaproteobacteria bacterium]|nr:MAG: hypothetical protein D6729_10640 [Deltaproteobacteria bacterium]